jgi:hypothetical protein
LLQIASAFRSIQTCLLTVNINLHNVKQALWKQISDFIDALLGVAAAYTQEAAASSVLCRRETEEIKAFLVHRN